MRDGEFLIACEALWPIEESVIV